MTKSLKKSSCYLKGQSTGFPRMKSSARVLCVPGHLEPNYITPAHFVYRLPDARDKTCLSQHALREISSCVARRRRISRRAHCSVEMARHRDARASQVSSAEGPRSRRFQGGLTARAFFWVLSRAQRDVCPRKAGTKPMGINRVRHFVTGSPGREPHHGSHQRRRRFWPSFRQLPCRLSVLHFELVGEEADKAERGRIVDRRGKGEARDALDSRGCREEGEGGKNGSPWG
ncbi:hypothetical protein BKA93DRAFT_156844 [Sparassis latifolia]